MNRRQFLGNSTALALATPLWGWVSGCAAPTTRTGEAELSDPTIDELQQALTQGRWTSVDLVAFYRRRIGEIDRAGPRLNSVLELNPDADRIAADLDRERRHGRTRGPLHGIPILLKDNIDTHDRMMTTAGSLALLGSVAPRDAFLVERLRAAGVVILGKTNLSEWANFRGSQSSSGWSGRGGQTRNPHVTDRDPSGSSSGSAVAVAANLCAAAVGTETDGSIVSPASHCGVVGLKPTVGLISRSGVIPISSSQDTAGPMARCVADVAALLGGLVGEDTQDPASTASAARAQRDYTQFLSADGLLGVRVGVLRGQFKVHRRADPHYEQSLTVISQSGGTLVDPVQLPSFGEVGAAEYQVLLHEFKVGVNAYLANLGPHAPVKSLAEVIAFNEREAVRELSCFGQETLVKAEATSGLEAPQYLAAKERCRRWRDDLAAAFVKLGVDVLVAPTAGPAGTLDALLGDHGRGGSSSFAAVAGFPSITVPCGAVEGLPVGLSFIAGAWQEPKLLAVAYAFEQATRARIRPRFRPQVSPG